jgi:hypothetical protein
MISTEIKFTIQCLDGDTFQVSIPRTEAEKIMPRHANQYDKYGLDVLNDVISKHNGTDPITHQLFGDQELTISTPLIPLENKVITLMIKPSFRIEFSLGPSSSWQYEYQLYDNITDLSHDSVLRVSREPILSYSQRDIPQIEVIGQYRDFLKIASQKLPHFRNNNFHQTPPLKYVWLRYDKWSMKIV